MEYLVNNKRYSYSYKELKAKYLELCALSDEEFVGRLGEVLHFACFTAYIKELSTEDTLSDEGIIHQLVHLLTLNDPIIDIKGIREQFRDVLKLA